MTVAWEDYGTYATDVFTREAERVIRGHDTTNPLYEVLLSAMLLSAVLLSAGTAQVPVPGA